MHSVVKRKLESGFSLIEITISMAVLGALSLVTMKLVDNQMQSEGLLKSRSEITKTVATIIQSINNKSRCFDMVGGKAPTDDGFDLSPLEYKDENEAKTRELLAAGNRYREFRVQSILLKKNPVTDDLADIEIIFQVNKKGISLLRSDVTSAVVNIKKTISFIISKDPGYNITGCGPAVGESNDLAKQNMCGEIGFVWTAGTPGTCTPPPPPTVLECPIGQIPSAMTTLTQLNCVNIRAHINLNDFFDFSPAAGPCLAPLGISIGEAGGKYKVVCLP